MREGVINEGLLIPSGLRRTIDRYGNALGGPVLMATPAPFNMESGSGDDGGGGGGNGGGGGGGG